MIDTIYANYGKNSTSMACPILWIFFGKFVRDSKLQMGVIRKQYFELTIIILKVSLEGRWLEWDLYQKGLSG